MPVLRRRGRPARLIKLAAFQAVAAAMVLLALRLDGFVFEHVNNRHGVDRWLYLGVRQLGEMETWLVIAVIVMVVDGLSASRRTLLGAFERGLIVIWAPMLGGLVSTLLKLVVRRERPDAHAGEYVFRPWTDATWDSSGLGFTSGHSAVALGGAFILSMLYPRLAPLWLLGAALCGLSRLMTQAHFFSDVVGGAVVGLACAWLVWTMYRTWFEDRDPVLMRLRRALKRRRSAHHTDLMR